jgi:ketosteroid isomerase-like protein
VTRGRRAIFDRFKNVFQTTGPASAYTISTLEVWLVDDLAYETGNFSGKVQPKGQAPESFSGKYVTVWKRQSDGSWKIYVDFGVPKD